MRNGMGILHPDDLALFCEKHVYEHTYIFIDKVEDGYRKAVCGHCGRRSKIKSANATPGKYIICPKCGLQTRFRGKWNTAPKEKSKVCITHRVDGQLLLRWVKVTRTYKDSKCRYDFDEYYKNLYIQTPKGEIIYSYRFFFMMYHGWDWYRKEDGTANNEETHVYSYNISEVFGDSFHHVNLQEALFNIGAISFPRLIHNLQNIPAAEYLFKLGLTKLAANFYADDLQKGNKFSEVLGISAQYLPLYRKYNVSVNEHRIIQASKTWVSHENFAKLRLLLRDAFFTDDLVELLGTMSFERFVNYFTKQKVLLKKKLQFLITQYKDYIHMSEGLKVDLSRKLVRFPANIIESHDVILERYNEVKHEIEDENFIQATEKLYAGMDEYSKGVYCIVLPKTRSDLITEGQSLRHCVGAESYYKNHITGKSMIFFVRKIKEPKKPFFTLEIDMRELKIRQLHGYCHCAPTADVKRFVGEFLRRLKPSA
jgi:hypothetical protein